MLGRLIAVIAFSTTVMIGTAVAQSCQQTAGATRARELVRQCIQVSPASHPPCNVSNPCEMMTDEIQRGCGMYPRPAPSFCRAATSVPSPMRPPASSQSGAYNYACPTALGGFPLLNWTMRDKAGSGKVRSTGQTDMVWNLTRAQAQRGSVRIVCGYDGTDRVNEIVVRQGLRRCLNAEMTSTYECN